MNQLASIHVKKKQLGLEEDDYRNLLQRVTGKRSSKDLSSTERFRVIQEMDRLGAPKHAKAPKKKSQLEGRYAPVLKALWLTAYNLGIVSDRRDAALVKFVERQTGISHVAWVKDAGDAAKAIEGLKKWVEREGRLSLRHFDPIDRKKAVVKAQLRMMGSTSAVSLDTLSGKDLDQLIARNGEAIRSMKTGKAGK